MERALREIEELTRLAMQAGRMFAFEWNPSTDEVRRSHDVAEIIGFTGDGTREAGRDSLQRVHPEDRERLIRIVKSLTTANDSYETEYQVILPSGQIATFQQNARAYFDGGGHMIRLIGMTADITERKRTMEGLEKREAELRQLIQKLPIAIASADEHGRIDYVNDQFLVNFGYTLDEIADPDAWWERAYPDERYRREVINSWGNSVEQATRQGQCIKPFEYRVTCKDGTVRVAEILGATVGDRKLILFNDLTERKKAEFALRESEERFRRVFEESPLGVALVGKDYHFLKVNSALCRMVGYAEAELTQMSFVDITHSEDLAANMELAGRLFRHEISGYRLQKRYVKKDGDIIWVNMTASVIRDAEGLPLYGLAMIEDITESKRAHEEAIVRQKLESLGVLAGGIAHDFNNLLGSILAEAELAAADLAAGSSPGEELQRIRTIAIRGAEIVRELMIYSGQDKAKLVAPLDVSLLVEEMLELLKVSISKHVVLKTDLSRDLPAVRGNAPQLRQVVMNLIINASEAIGEQDAVITVSTSRVTGQDLVATCGTNVPEGDYVRLGVSDTGCGMTEEVQAKVFDPFFSTKFAGRGLGLGVVQGIVRDHSGAINLVSAPGQGTTLEVFLPCAGEKAQSSRGAIVRASGKEHRPRSGTLLFVEDEDMLRLAVSKMLRKHGFRVIEAIDGSSALELVRTHKDEIDFMLLDVSVPGVSSQEVFEEARYRRPNLKVILTSAYSRETVDASFAGLRIERFIRKPFQIADLMGLLQDVLSTETGRPPLPGASF
jgi:PAS domain S-box-containing protein